LMKTLTYRRCVVVKRLRRNRGSLWKGSKYKIKEIEKRE
jgi:hypothetical protein